MPAIQLRVYLPIHHLGRQFAAAMGTPTRARGNPPMEHDHALIIEVAPGPCDRARDRPRAEGRCPDVEPGILFVERQFGVLEVHSKNREDVERAGAAILEGDRRRGGASSCARARSTRT